MQGKNDKIFSCWEVSKGGSNKKKTLNVNVYFERERCNKKGQLYLNTVWLFFPFHFE